MSVNNSVGENQYQREGAGAAYKFTREELAVLRECNQESFYRRCLPLSTGLGFAAYYAMKTGYMKQSVRWGVIPKVALAAFAGYCIGKFSYRKVCIEKIMKLENSPLADSLRQRLHRATPGKEFLSDNYNSNSSMIRDNFENYSEQGPRSLDMDTMLPLKDDDIHFQPDDFNFDREKETMDKKPKGRTTYEELRLQNRNEYEANRLKVPPAVPSSRFEEERNFQRRNEDNNETWMR